MDIQVDSTRPFVVAKLVGDFTARYSDVFTEQLQEFAHGEQAALAIDLSQLTLIDSTGLAAMINLVTRSRLSSGRVVLVAPSAFVRGILEVTHLDRWFEVFETMDQASERLSSD